MMLQLHNIHCIYCLYVCLYMYSKPYWFVFILFLYSYICVLHVLFFSYSVIVSCPQKSLTSCMTGRFLCWWSNWGRWRRQGRSSSSRRLRRTQRRRGTCSLTSLPLQPSTRITSRWRTLTVRYSCRESRQSSLRSWVRRSDNNVNVTVWSEDTVGLDHSFHLNTIAEMTWRG